MTAILERRFVVIDASLAERRLLTYLQSKYNSIERPTSNISEAIEVKLLMILQQVIEAEAPQPSSDARFLDRRHGLSRLVTARVFRRNEEHRLQDDLELIA